MTFAHVNFLPLNVGVGEWACAFFVVVFYIVEYSFLPPSDFVFSFLIFIFSCEGKMGIKNVLDRRKATEKWEPNKLTHE